MKKTEKFTFASPRDPLYKDDGLNQFCQFEIVNNVGDKCTVITSDLGFLLMNKDRLSRLDPGLLGILSDHFNGSSDYSALDDFSDEEKLSVLKSRYAQSPSEIENFSKYISENYSSLVDELNSIHSSSQSAEPPASSDE